MSHLDAIAIARVRAYPPRVSSFTSTFWQALAHRRWTTTTCEACGKPTFPPKPACPHCWSTHLRWIEPAATGTLYSWTRVHAAPAAFADEAPYLLGIVDLDDGLRLACRLVSQHGTEPVCAMAVGIVVLEYLDGPLLGARLQP